MWETNFSIFAMKVQWVSCLICRIVFWWFKLMDQQRNICLNTKFLRQILTRDIAYWKIRCMMLCTRMLAPQISPSQFHQSVIYTFSLFAQHQTQMQPRWEKLRYALLQGWYCTLFFLMGDTSNPRYGPSKKTTYNEAWDWQCRLLLSEYPFVFLPVGNQKLVGKYFWVTELEGRFSNQWYLWLLVIDAEICYMLKNTLFRGRSNHLAWIIEYKIWWYWAKFQSSVETVI